MANNFIKIQLRTREYNIYMGNRCPVDDAIRYAWISYTINFLIKVPETLYYMFSLAMSLLFGHTE